MKNVTLGEFFEGVAHVIGFLGLAAIVVGVTVLFAGGSSLALWNLVSLLGLLPVIPVGYWIAAMIFFSLPWQLGTLNQFLFK